MLVYACDPGEPAKRDQAARVLRFLEQSGSGRLSVQGLSEFVSATTRRLRPPLTTSEPTQQVERLMASFSIFDLTPIDLIENKVSRRSPGDEVTGLQNCARSIGLKISRIYSALR